MFLGGNWVDLIIIFLFIFFAAEAWRVGFWVILIDFISFLISLLISLSLYSKASDFIRSIFSINRGVANALGFLIMAIITEAVIGYLLAKLFRKLPEKWRTQKLLRPAALIPAIGETLVLVAFFLILIISFPVSPIIKGKISDSKIGGFLVRETSGLEVQLSGIFGGIIEDSLTHLIIKPGSSERIPLTIDSKELSLDEQAENEMFSLVNEERRSRGLSELVWRPETVLVARSHARDMWERSYFGHISPEGNDVGDRLEKAGINYYIAGENLALSPTTQIAHTGLMNSEGHRANILSQDFKRVGIGVIDNGYYGKMFVQVFTD